MGRFLPSHGVRRSTHESRRESKVDEGGRRRGGWFLQKTLIYTLRSSKFKDVLIDVNSKKFHGKSLDYYFSFIYKTSYFKIRP